MVWLPDGEKNLKICLFVLTEATNVTDEQTDRQTDKQTPHDGIGGAYAGHHTHTHNFIHQRMADTKIHRNVRNISIARQTSN